MRRTDTRRDDQIGVVSSILRALMLTMLISAVVISTATGAADIYVNETGWWYDGATVMLISCLTPCIAFVDSVNNTSSNRSEWLNAIMATIAEPLICRRLNNEEN